MGSEAQCLEVGEAARPPAGAAAGFSSPDFLQLAEALPHMVWVCGEDGRLHYMNAEGREYFGADPVESVPGFPANVWAHPDDRETAQLAWDQSLRSAQALSVELRLRRRDGVFRWHVLRAQPVLDEHRRPVRWMGSCVHVHDAREASGVSAFLLELSTDMARIDNPHELVCTAMQRLRQQLGVMQVTLAEFDEERDEVVILRQGSADAAGLRVAHLPLAPFGALMAEARGGRAVVQHDLRGSLLGPLHEQWFDLEAVGSTVSAPMLQGGFLVALLAVAERVPRHWSPSEVELTTRVAEIVWPALEKARTDRALAVSEERLRLAQAVAQIGIWELDPQAHSLSVSGESFELFGLDEQDLHLYETWLEHIDPRDRHVVGEMIKACEAAGSAEVEYRYRHPQHGSRWIYSRAGNVDEGEHSSIVGISLDITQRRRTEEELKDVNQRKDEFLAMLAHELRNPLAPIRNAAQILRAHSTGQPELEWARTVIERQTRHLVRLVDDLLDVSRMVRRQIVLRKVPVNLSELVQHATETSRPLIRARRHRLHINVPRANVIFDGDLTRLAQVLSNLLNNAAKYTEECGEIFLDAGVEGRQVVLRVRDTGPGIAAGLLPHVFELFTQAERPLDRGPGGLGIGLTLVKIVVEMHGGSVEVRNSAAGQGAEFVVRLPAQPGSDESVVRRTHSANIAGPDSESMKGPDAPMRILVVDDNVDAADSIALLLGLDGFETHSVHSAAAALEMAASFKPDVMLLDIGLPIMDGYEVARRLRASIPIAQMRIVALSGYGQAADRARAAQAGFDDYLVKPVEPATLSEFLRSLPRG